MANKKLSAYSPAIAPAAAGDYIVGVKDVATTPDNSVHTWTQLIAYVDANANFLASLIGDTSPQLGAALDTNAFDIEFDDLKGIRDDSQNEMLLFDKRAAAVNYFQIRNGETGISPTLAALGDDADISLEINAKGTGRVVIGGDSMRIPSAAAPTFAAAGDLALDTTVTDWTGGVLKYFGAATMGIVAMPVAEFTTPTNAAVPTYNSATNEFELTVPAGGGNVSNVATPLNNQIGVWTGATTLEGDADFLWHGTYLEITGGILLNERADHAATPVAGKAELWVSNDATQKLYFTDDAGVDNEIALGLNTVADPGADGILVWDDGDTAGTEAQWATFGAGIAFSGTALSIDVASATVAGIAELATVAETDTGTDAGRTITPDGLAGSYAGTKELGIVLWESDEAVVVGDGTQGIPIPASFNGMNVVSVTAFVDDKGITGTTNVAMRRRRAGAEVDVLSTLITLGNEWFAADGTINTANDDLATGDMLYCDVDVIHSGTAPNGLSIAIECRLP